jgi:hypothetical protein
MRSRSRALLSVPLLAVALLPGALGLVRTASRVIVPEGDVIAEDLTAVAGRVIIEGTVEGDLIVVVGELTITGSVTGDVIGFASTRVRVDGTVDGSVRIASPSISIGGAVGDDVAALAVDADLDAVVGRDVLVVAGSADVAGTTGRDVRGQAWWFDVAGEVGRDVLVKADSLDLEAGTRVAGDVLYLASSDAGVADAATVQGRLVRRTVLEPVWARAVERLVAVLGLLGLVLGGLTLAWLFRRTTRRAVAVTGDRPLAALGTGVALVLLPPLVAVPLSLTLVGLPVALLLLVLWVIGLFLGAVPAVSWAAGRLLGGRGGLPAAIVVGALLWRGAMWLFPLAAVLLFLAAVVMGLGSFGVAAWEQRRAA